MSEEPESLVLQLLRQMRAELGEVRADVRDLKENGATKSDLNSLRGDMTSLRADVASDLIVMRKELSEQIVGLRRAVVE